MASWIQGLVKRIDETLDIDEDPSTLFPGKHNSSRKACTAAAPLPHFCFACTLPPPFFFVLFVLLCCPDAFGVAVLGVAVFAEEKRAAAAKARTAAATLPAPLPPGLEEHDDDDDDHDHDVAGVSAGDRGGWSKAVQETDRSSGEGEHGGNARARREGPKQVVKSKCRASRLGSTASSRSNSRSSSRLGSRSNSKQRLSTKQVCSNHVEGVCVCERARGTHTHTRTHTYIPTHAHAQQDADSDWDEFPDDQEHSTKSADTKPSDSTIPAQAKRAEAKGETAQIPEHVQQAVEDTAAPEHSDAQSQDSSEAGAGSAQGKSQLVDSDSSGLQAQTPTANDSAGERHHDDAAEHQAVSCENAPQQQQQQQQQQQGQQGQQEREEGESKPEEEQKSGGLQEGGNKEKGCEENEQQHVDQGGRREEAAAANGAGPENEETGKEEKGEVEEEEEEKEKEESRHDATHQSSEVGHGTNVCCCLCSTFIY